MVHIDILNVTSIKEFIVSFTLIIFEYALNQRTRFKKYMVNLYESLNLFIILSLDEV